ncbi:MAG: hypothetical protein JXA30_21200 [Deltaproteobacteria bacterium]|nr:hypothetical protein [Deltaproteobacteria bacterium]
MATETDRKSVSIIFNEVQLLLAEKRTSLSVLRTGITVFLLPLSVLSVLVATSKYYDFFRVMHLLVPLLILCAGLIVLGVYLTHHSIIKIRKYDASINKLRERYSILDDFIG